MSVGDLCSVVPGPMTTDMPSCQSALFLCFRAILIDVSHEELQRFEIGLRPLTMVLAPWVKPGVVDAHHLLHWNEIRYGSIQEVSRSAVVRHNHRQPAGHRFQDGQSPPFSPCGHYKSVRTVIKLNQRLKGPRPAHSDSRV